MTKPEQIKLIRAAYAALDRANLQDGFHDVADRLYAMNAAAERQHRRGVGGGYALSVADAARLFTFRHLAEALDKPGRYTVADILEIRIECLYAQAYAEKHEPEIRKAFADAGITLADILALNYSELVR